MLPSEDIEDIDFLLQNSKSIEDYDFKEMIAKYDLENFIKNDLSNFRWTIDYLEDLELVRQIISKIKVRPILINNILTLISQNPELKKINQNYHKK